MFQDHLIPLGGITPRCFDLKERMSGSGISGGYGVATKERTNPNSIAGVSACCAIRGCGIRASNLRKISLVQSGKVLAGCDPYRGAELSYVANC